MNPKANVSLVQRRLIMAFVAGVFSLVALASAARETIDSLAQKADAIVVGKCLGKKTLVQKRLFVTTHEIQVTECLKGKAVRAGETVTVASLGGSFKEPPVSQYVTNQPHIVEGEEVLLFLRQPQAAHDKRSEELLPALRTSATVVGGAEGKFSIVTNPHDKKRKVVSVRCENYGIMADDRLLNTILRAIEKGSLETTDTSELVDLGGGVRGPDSAREALDKAAKITESLRAARPEDSDKIIQPGRLPIPAPSLDDVKARIARILNRQ